MKHSLTALLLLFLSLKMNAQGSSMEEFMYSSGKINVVIGVVLIILLLIFLYLFRLESRIRKMEQGDD